MEMNEKKTPYAKMLLSSTRSVFFGENRYLRVVEQPRGKPEYVATHKDTLTNFQLASRYGSLGLLAHNYEAGKYFCELKIGDTLRLMDGNGNSLPYCVKQVKRYQALSPHSPRSKFVDLETLEKISAADVFKRVYIGDGSKLILQTCIEEGEEKEWGRLFVICEPQE